MKIDWGPLRTELATWRAEGLALPLWWRDDDAVAETSALHRLLTLSDKVALPLHLAVIPQPAEAPLTQVCSRHPNCIPMVHGWTHQNHAPEGAKKAEFGHARPGAAGETAQALDRMRALFGPRLFEMFVPPWNRIDDTLVAQLHTQGYRALSTYTPRATRKVAGVVQINTHIDPIDWKAGGGLVRPERTLGLLVQTLQDRRHGRTDRHEPLGFLTHHLVHDTPIWDFTNHCLSELLNGGATPCNLFDLKDNLP